MRYTTASEADQEIRRLMSGRTPMEKLQEAIFRGVEIPESKGICTNCGAVAFKGERHSCGLG
jgi:hypothetical protein